MKNAQKHFIYAVLVLVSSLLILAIPVAVAWLLVVQSPYNVDLAIGILIAVGGVSFLAGVIISAIRAEKKSFSQCENTQCVNQKYARLCKDIFL